MNQSMVDRLILISDHWKDQGPDKCPVTSVWDAPAGWPRDEVPSFYLSGEDLSCVDQSGTSSTSSGKVSVCVS